MKKKNEILRRLAFLLMLTMLVGSVVPQGRFSASAEMTVRAANAGLSGETAASSGANVTTAAPGTEAANTTADGIVRIRTAQDFLDFAKNCTIESYSRGKLFSLEQDIDLSGDATVPAGVFAGTFEGNGHKITGIRITASGTDYGLFRYVQKDGCVQNLTVSGSVTPGGKKQYIGGIAGRNRGRILSCIFEGEVSGTDSAGGIAGFNEESGQILSCENRGQITGETKIGGIAGKNEGSLQQSENMGSINTMLPEDDEDSNGLSSLNLEDTFSESSGRSVLQSEKINDVGGIAGISTGLIQSCTNYGQVGCEHAGYNIGGIVGRQSGALNQSKNQGVVWGRKDVGGIAGQLEPYVTIRYDSDTFDRLEENKDSLQSELNRLSDRGDTLSDVIKDSANRISDQTDVVSDDLKGTKDTLRTHKDILKDDTDAWSADLDDSLNDIEDTLNEFDVDLLSSGTKHAIARIRSNNARIRELLAQLAQAGGGLATSSDADPLILNEDDPEDILAMMEEGDIPEDLLERYTILLELETAVKSIVSDLTYLIVNIPADTYDNAADFVDGLDELRDGMTSLIDVIREDKEDAGDKIDAFDEELTGKLDGLYDNMDLLRDQIKDSRSQIEEEADRIGDQMDALRDELDKVGDTLTDGKESLRGKIEDLLDDDTDLFEDVSEEVLQMERLEETRGIIMNCKNSGEIRGDYQTGGIVGMIGIEWTDHPEDDIETSGSRTLEMIRSVRAAVLSSGNEGLIRAENHDAGGIVGRGALGAVMGSENYGDIFVTDGDYAGGIAGRMNGSLQKNYCLASISGNNDIGGIAGEALNLSENCAMTLITASEGGYAGSIVGNAKEDGTISGNLYVDHGLGAVDGITFEGQAEALSYEELTARSDVPAAFSHLHVSFVADDSIIEQIACSYGETLSDIRIPDPPKKDGFYYTWDIPETDRVLGNLTIRALYAPWTLTIASSDELYPLMLAEGNFRPGARLLVEEQNREGVRGPVYEFSIEGTDVEELTDVRCHILAKDPRYTGVALLTDGEYREIASQRDGDYLIFSAGGNGEICLLEQTLPKYIWLLAGGAAMLMLLVALMIISKKKRTMHGNHSILNGSDSGDESAGSEDAD